MSVGSGSGTRRKKERGEREGELGNGRNVRVVMLVKHSVTLLQETCIFPIAAATSLPQT